jgi:hypothetical protein
VTGADSPAPIGPPARVVLAARGRAGAGPRARTGTRTKLRATPDPIIGTGHEEGGRMGLRRRRSTSGADGSSGAGEAAADVAALATRKAGRAARRAGAAVEDAGRARRPLTVGRAKRMIGVGKAVAPLLAPYALAAATVARARWDAYRAARLGVEPGQLSAYAGPGGALHARLSRMAEALDALESGAEARSTDAAHRFALDTRPRLADLAVAVRAAEQMPAPRRRTAYRSIGAELDRIELALLQHLGVQG